jgi:hypothetical protein
MAYKVELQAVDLDWQIKLLELEPQIANSHLYPAMQRSVRALKTAIGSRMAFNDFTGDTRSTMQSKVSGQGMRMSGRVGWWGAGMPITPNILEHGAGPHFIGFVPALGVTVDHPGQPALKFVEGGADENEPYVLQQMEQAAQNITNDLAVK